MNGDRIQGNCKQIARQVTHEAEKQVAQWQNKATDSWFANNTDAV